MVSQSYFFVWCWALNELWITHAVAFVRISITRCHPCRSKPRLVLFLFLLLPTVYFEWTRFLFEYPLSTKGFSEFHLGIWYKYLKKKGIPFTTKSAHVQHAPVQASQTRPGDYRPGIKPKQYDPLPPINRPYFFSPPYFLSPLTVSVLLLCQLKTTGFTKCRCLIGIFRIIRRICARNMTVHEQHPSGCGTSNFNHILDTSTLP